MLKRTRGNRYDVNRVCLPYFVCISFHMKAKLDFLCFQTKLYHSFDCNVNGAQTNSKPPHTHIHTRCQSQSHSQYEGFLVETTKDPNRIKADENCWQFVATKNSVMGVSRSNFKTSHTAHIKLYVICRNSVKITVVYSQIANPYKRNAKPFKFFWLVLLVFPICVFFNSPMKPPKYTNTGTHA